MKGKSTLSTVMILSFQTDANNINPGLTASVGV